MERTGIDRSTTAAVIGRLRRKGLLQRRRSAGDARAYSVRLTDEGRRVLHAVAPLATRVDRRVLEALPSERRKAFLTALASIVTALEGPAS
jgi:DNA-binding MarR family transcriptional regulator